jgi:hypothetical protein
LVGDERRRAAVAGRLEFEQAVEDHQRVAARIFIDETRDTSREQRLDLPGLIASAVGLFALTYGLIETNDHAWGSTRVLTLFAVAIVALGIFVLLELRQRIPMLDLSLFRDPTFSGAAADAIAGCAVRLDA